MGWSWDDLMAAPSDVVDEIIRAMIEEQEELERLRTQ